MYTLHERTQSFIASGDLRGMINRAVTMLSVDFKVSGADAANVADGILLNQPNTGEHASVVTDGITMGKVGAAVTAGQLLTNAASGWLIAAAVTAGKQRVIGRAMTGAASGMLAAVDVRLFYLPNSIA